MGLTSQGYSKAEIGRLVGCSVSTVRRVIERAAKRIPAENTKSYRELQLLRYERLMEACQTVLAANHVVVSNGHVVRQVALDDEGKVIWDPVLGPDGLQRHDLDGNPVFEERKVPLEDHAAVLEAVAEMRKIEAEIMKLLGTQTPVKQAVELQHVAYEITGVDMSAVMGTNINQT
jgi:hypothetical protein